MDRNLQRTFQAAGELPPAKFWSAHDGDKLNPDYIAFREYFEATLAAAGYTREAWFADAQRSKAFFEAMHRVVYRNGAVSCEGAGSSFTVGLTRGIGCRRCRV